MPSWTRSARPRPPNAVVDAPVLVSALPFPGSLPGRVVAFADEKACALHFSTILLELARLTPLGEQSSVPDNARGSDQAGQQ